MDLQTIERLIAERRDFVTNRVHVCKYLSSYNLADAAKNMKEVEKLETAYQLLFTFATKGDIHND